jgi:hypothetical protein
VLALRYPGPVAARAASGVRTVSMEGAIRRHDMSETDRNTNSLDVLFRPASHYDSPDDVLNDGELSVAEKRVILSSWASDMYAVESCPWLREVPGMVQPVALKDILAALRRLDPDNDDPPPRGPAAMRVVPFTHLKLFPRGRRGLMAANETQNAAPYRERLKSR